MQQVLLFNSSAGSDLLMDHRDLSTPMSLQSAKPYLWPIALAFCIFLASGTQRLATPDLGFQFSKDKLAHFLVFGLLATAVLRTPRFNDLRLRSLILAALAASAYGAFDEFRQSLTPGRSVELADWFADTLGAFVAVLVYARWHGYRRFLEWRRRPKAHATEASLRIRTGDTA